MRQVWTSETECMIGDVPIRVANGGYDALRTTADNAWVLKGRSFFESYPILLQDQVPRTVLELGIFEGGSALLFADRWQQARIVGIDIRDPNPEVLAHVRRLGFADRLRLHYNLSQADRDGMEAAIASGFGGEPIDLVIDDASHHYDLTRSAFEIVFPHLRPGGYYIVEDWGWAHWRDWQGVEQWKDDPALSNLLFEISLAAATSSAVIAEVVVNASLFAVRKSPQCPPLGRDFRLDNFYAARGKRLTLI